MVLSTRADLVTGSDALVQLTGLPSSAQSMQILLNGESVRDEFALRQNGQFEGLVTGLRLGRNLLEARLPDGAGARLVITDHPISGPLFSGPQIQPWSCQPGDSDAQCDHPTEYSFLYYSTTCVCLCSTRLRCSLTNRIPWPSSPPVEAVLSRASRLMTRPAPQRPFRWLPPTKASRCPTSSAWSGYGRTVTRLTSPYSPCRERTSSRGRTPIRPGIETSR